MPQLLGFSHIDLTVSDCDRTAKWWHDVLGFTLVHTVHEATFECRSMLHASGLAVTLMTHSATADLGTFDERRVGLDHLAFQVTDRDELDRWASKLDANEVTHSGVIDTGYGPTLVFRDPDNMQLELFVHPNPVDLTRLTDAESPEAQRVLGVDQ
ncbi:MAG TPA: VOC family protein [Mycobacterium sp.]|jgi:glyoxylase I family protein|nr:VOC family protein [Mycobacterium sp.]